jgi:peptide-methionine (S)-S-oxide reductase
MAKATFGAGCFWGVEAAFRRIEGVRATAVGYAGGHLDQPTYKDVCYKGTGHAEVVEVDYDPDVVSYEALLDVFWDSHDPTQLNRQGPDEASKARLEAAGRYRRPIVTQILPAPTFWKAEDYHQQYLEKRGLAVCHVG